MRWLCLYLSYSLTKIMSYRAYVYLFHLGIKIACLLPRSIVVLIAKTLALFRFFQAKKERAIVKKNLLMCGVNPNWRNVLKNFTNYAICLADAFRSLIYSADIKEKSNSICGQNRSTYLEKRVEVKGLKHLDQVLKLNQGAILVTAHLGNWDLAGVFLAGLGYRLTAVAEEIPGLSRVYNLIRTRTGMEIVFIREKEKMVSALKNNRVLVLLADRDLTGRGQLVNFLYGKKRIPRGPAAFAIKYQAPIIFGYFVLNQTKEQIYQAELSESTSPKNKKPKKIYYAEISEPIFPKTENQEELLQLIADKLSEYIKRYPEQWFVYRDEWED